MRPLLTPRWLARHALAVTLVLACAVLTWWQVVRAVGGNLLSYGYALLWPVFGAFVIVIWVREMRLAVGVPPPAAPEPEPERQAGFGRPVLTRRPVTAVSAPGAAEDDPALAEYNRLLAWLADNPGARPADYPGGRSTGPVREESR